MDITAAIMTVAQVRKYAIELEERIRELEREKLLLANKAGHLDKLVELGIVSIGIAAESRDELKHSGRKMAGENKELREALRPFAEFAASLTGPNRLPYGCPVCADPEALPGRLSVAHFRHAAEVLK